MNHTEFKGLIDLYEKGLISKQALKEAMEATGYSIAFDIETNPLEIDKDTAPLEKGDDPGYKHGDQVPLSF